MAPHEPSPLNKAWCSANITIIDDGNGVGQALVDLCQQHQLSATLSSTLPDSLGDVVIYLGGLRTLSSIDAAIAINQEAFQIAHQLAPHFLEHNGLFVTVQSTGSHFALDTSSSPYHWTAGLAGLAKTADKEWPISKAKAIDIETTKQTASQLAQRLWVEIFQGGDDIEVGLQVSGARTTLQSVYAQLPHKPITAIEDNSVLVVTGGARGITAACLIALAKQKRLRIALLGRTVLQPQADEFIEYQQEAELKRAVFAKAAQTGEKPTPKTIAKKVRAIQANREIQATLSALEQAGSIARYFNTDIQNETSVQTTLQRIRDEWGTIQGVIHGAGVLADKMLQDKTLDMFQRVFNTKVKGLQILLNQTTEDPLQLLCVFSSVAGRYGNSGQADYAMANEVLNKIANLEQQRRGDACLVKAYNWGPWESGMVTDALKKMFAQRDITPLPKATGAQLFVEELTDSSRSYTEVVLGSALEKIDNIRMPYMIHRHTHDYLFSHCIKGMPVVPMCLALTWMLSTARLLYPDLYPVVEGMTVLKGIVLQDHLARPHQFNVHYQINQQCQPLTITMEIRAIDNTLHYQANILMERHQPNIDLSVPAISGQTWPWDIQDIYDGEKLFHGKALHVIDRLDQLSKTGASAAIKAHMDVALLDGGLQLLRLWGLAQTERLSLPTKITTFIPLQPLDEIQSAYCVLQANQKNKHQIQSNIYWKNTDGQLCAVMRDVEFTLQTG